MEKVKTREEAASRLKAKEEEINRRFEALQDEVKQTKEDVFGFVKANPWVGICGTTLAGVVVGFLLGGKGKKPKTKRLSKLMCVVFLKWSGIQVVPRNKLVLSCVRRFVIRFHKSCIPVPKKKSAGLTGKLFGMVTDIAFGYLSKTLMNTIEAQLSSRLSSSEQHVPEEQS